ncbi:MAG TPA: type II toxin-antitoxin system HicA family toxin [Streptosporangiaceae bacterium]
MKLLNRIIGGAVTNVSFSDLVVLLEALGFEEVGGKGSHRVFTRLGVIEILTLQEVRGQAKPYQVRQVAAVVRRYNLQLEDEA